MPLAKIEVRKSRSPEQVQALIEAVYLGSSFKLRLRAGARELIVRQPARGKLPQPGERISIGIEPDEIHVFDL